MTKEAFVALVTCFNDDETVNYAATRAQVRRQVAAGNNIMCAGTNGDFTALTFDEKVRLCGEVVDEVGGKAKVIVNAGMPATFETILLAREFEKIGVDGIAVITPFFIRDPGRADPPLLRGGGRGDDADLPLRHPGAHPEPHRARDREDARRPRQHRRHQGLGRRAGDARSLSQVGREVPGFEVYSGPDHLVLWAFQNGAKGCISGLGNVMPDTLAAIVPAFNAGDDGRRRGGAGSLRRLPQGPLHPRLPARAGEALALPDGRLGRRQPPAGAPARSRAGQENRRAPGQARPDGRGRA